jgi:hypothetical protein
MLPNETFFQKTNSDTDVVILGGYKAELVNCCDEVVKDITSNFFFYGFEDNKGIKQIRFEFGNIGEDFFTEPLYLKLTDLINSNIWYSNAFLVTAYQSHLSERFDYKNKTTIFGIDHELFNDMLSVRFRNFYDHTPANKREQGKYVDSNGLEVLYRSVVTFGRKHLMAKIDYFINDRFEVLISHDEIYLNFERVTISDFKTAERLGTANFFPADFTINPKDETYNFVYQLYQGLEVISRVLMHEEIVGSTDGLFSLTFNKNILILPTTKVQLFENGVFVSEVTPTVVDNVLNIDFSSYPFTLKEYSLVVNANDVYSGIEKFVGYILNQWKFTLADYYNSDYYLT